MRTFAFLLFIAGAAHGLGRPPLVPKALVLRGGAGGGSLKKAASGGLAGSAAGAAQVILFMWLRTVMNYQYRHGGSTMAVLNKLWAEGKLRRLYRGLPFALVQGPLSRFGSAASNSLVVAWRENKVMGLDKYPMFLVTAVGSLLTALWRAFWMPIDTLKTVSQVEGKAGLNSLVDVVRVKKQFSLLYTGASAMALATAIGHYPWFLTYNLLDNLIPKQATSTTLRSTARSAALGFCSSFVSDVVANPIRVVKTTKQASAANATAVPYVDIVNDILRKEGPLAFFVRGLQTRLFVNGLQSMVFTILWRYLQGQ